MTRRRGSEQTIASFAKRTRGARGVYVLRCGDDTIGQWEHAAAQSMPDAWAAEVLQAARDDADARGAMVMYSLVCEGDGERPLATLPIRLDGGGAVEQADQHGQLAQLMRHLEAQARMNMLLTDRIVAISEKFAREQRELVRVALDRVTRLERERGEILDAEREAMAAALAAEHKDADGEREARVADKVIGLVQMGMMKAAASEKKAGGS